MKRRGFAPVAVKATCNLCRASTRSRPSHLFYFARGFTICESCIDILSGLLEDDRKAAPPSPPRPTPRLSNVELQQVTSPP